VIVNKEIEILGSLASRLTDRLCFLVKVNIAADPYD